MMGERGWLVEVEVEEEVGVAEAQVVGVKSVGRSELLGRRVCWLAFWWAALARVVAATVTIQRTRAAKKIDMSAPISSGIESLCSEMACWRMSMESLSASFTGAPSVLDVDHSCATHVRSVVFKAAKA